MLINTSRGKLFKTKDVVSGLKRGQIGSLEFLVIHLHSKRLLVFALFLIQNIF